MAATMTTTRQPMPHSKPARRACHSCQVSKIRCNSVSGSPCQQCHRRGVKCVTDPRSRRKRLQPKGWPTTVSGGDSTLGSMMGNTISLDDNSQYLPLGNEYAVLASHPTSEWSKADFDPTLVQSFYLNDQSSIGSLEDEIWNAFTHLNPAELHPPDTPSSVALLPGFIKALPMTMDPANLECLHTNEIFSLPSDPLQNALLQSFAECVLPSTPIVELQSFLNAIHDRDGRHGSVSLLLFYAVMFSATTFVELAHLLEAGYASRREAHESFYHKAKLLYQANSETDALAIVQALLLMTHRVDTADGDDSRHWIGIAVSTALSIGLFQDISVTGNTHCSPKLWRRIAWTCYMTDCLISLRLRCRPIIQREDFCHQILTEDDFHLYALPSQNSYPSPVCPIARDAEMREDLALMCIANARLCLCISEVLNLRGKERPIDAPITPPTSPTKAGENIDYATRVTTCEMGLADWANTLPPPCQAHPLGSINIDEDTTVVVQRSNLHMAFYTTVAVFHQLQPFPSSKFCVQHAALQITLIASELYQRGLHDRLSLVGVTGIFVALIIHMSGLKAPASLERDESLKNLRFCVDVMASLRDVYWEANGITVWASKAIENAVFVGDF